MYSEQGHSMNVSETPARTGLNGLPLSAAMAAVVAAAYLQLAGVVDLAPFLGLVWLPLAVPAGPGVLLAAAAVLAVAVAPSALFWPGNPGVEPNESAVALMASTITAAVVLAIIGIPSGSLSAMALMGPAYLWMKGAIPPVSSVFGVWRFRR